MRGYRGDTFFGKASGGDYQGRFIWYGGDIEAEAKLNRRVSIIYSFIPGYPQVIQNSLGLRAHF